MRERPSESLKQTANKLAQLIACGSTDTATLQALLQEFHADENIASHPVREDLQAPVASNAFVGIWKKTFTGKGMVFERDIKKKRQWHQWANVQKIYPKKEKKRIVLLGESVARGFFYDPYYTVAEELKGILENIPAMPPVEVTDLARTNCSMADLLELMHSFMALEPDGLVIFAGNNWAADFYDSFTHEDYAVLKMYFTKGSMAALKDFFENKLRKFIQSFFDKTAGLLSSAGIPIIFIVPGFNLADWKSSYNNRSLPWLPEQQVQSWFDLKVIAEKALIDNDATRLHAAASQMISLDPLNPYGYELLSKYFISAGQRERAGFNLELCRDTALVNRGDNNYPVCFGIIRQTILTAAKQKGFAVVDAHAVYALMAMDEIPGRKYFMDYCHLTIEAIRVTMQQTAKKVVQQLTGMEILLQDIPESGIEPGKEVRATAHFSAAIHNAHRDQPYEIILHHCREALSCSVDVKEIMLQYVNFSTRYASTALCGAFEATILSGKLRQYDGGFALQHPIGGKLMDIKLVNAIVEALDTTGIHIGHKVEELRLQEHAVGNEKVDLLESFYSRTSYNCFPGEHFNPGIVHARATESSFYFIAEGKHTLSFELTYRTPQYFLPDDVVKIVINGKEDQYIQLPMNERWQSTDFVIPVGLMINGLNKLTIQWPYRGLNNSTYRNDSPRDLLNLFSPVLGEIYSFSVIQKREVNVPAI